MITFITGRAGSGKSDEILKRIGEALEAENKCIREAPDADRKRMILLIPEQQAVIWESRAARFLPSSAPLNLEIVNFKRLCNLVRRKYGGMTKKTAEPGTRAAAMWSVLNANSGALRTLGSGSRTDRMVTPMLDAVAELKRSGIGIDDLSNAAGVLAGKEDGAAKRAGERARDLAVIAAEYNKILSDRFEDDDDLLGQTAETIREKGFFRGADVFVDSFFSLTAVETDILHSALRQADNVTITFTLDRKEHTDKKDGPPHRDTPQFETAWDFFTDMYAEAGGKAEFVSCTENRRTGVAALRYLESSLWRMDAKPFEGDSAKDHIRLLTAADRYDEAESAAAVVQSLVQSGARYSDVAVIARHADTLAGILDAAFTRHGIPFFLSERSDVSNHPAARLMLSALAVVQWWRRDAVIRCAKTGLCGLTPDECDALEMYTATWHIAGRKAFETEWTGKPEGYVAEESRRPEILARANAARKKLFGPIALLADAFLKTDGKDPTIRDGAKAVFDLLDGFHTESALQRYADGYEAAGQKERAQYERQICQTLMDALDQLVDVLPNANADAEVFASLLRQTLAAADVGAIPSGVDEVAIGSAARIRPGRIAHVIVLGAIEGEFPGIPRDDGYFSDAEKELLAKELNRPLSPTTDRRMSEELLWFYRAVTLPRESLTVFIPETSDGANAVPSVGAERIRTLFPELTPAPLPARERIRDTADTVRNARLLDDRDREVLRAKGILPACGEMPGLVAPKEDRLTPATADALYGDKLQLTQSKLDTFAGCPFLFTAKYVLRLEEEKDASLTYTNAGTFLHSVFELFFRKVKEHGLDFPLDEGTLETFRKEAVDETAAVICPDKNARTEYLISRLERFAVPVIASLNEEFGQSRFRPAALEEKIEDREAKKEGLPYLPAWEIAIDEADKDGRKVAVIGTIDRYDVYRSGNNAYVRVVDYKTGGKDFRESDLDDGVNMQLFLYLFTLCKCPPGEYKKKLTGGEGGEVLPAGVIYMNVRPDAAKNDTYLPDGEKTEEEAAQLVRKTLTVKGAVLNDTEILTAMDAAYAPDAKKSDFRYLPRNTDKQKTWGKETKFEEVREKIIGKIRERAGDILEGSCGADPKKHGGDQPPCKHCSMKPLCRAAKNA